MAIVNGQCSMWAERTSEPASLPTPTNALMLCNLVVVVPRALGASSALGVATGMLILSYCSYSHTLILILYVDLTSNNVNKIETAQLGQSGPAARGALPQRTTMIEQPCHTEDPTTTTSWYDAAVASSRGG